MDVKMLRKKLGVEAIERNWLLSKTSIETYFKISSTLIIPEGCVKIGDRVFQGCKELSKIKIPESVKEIRDGAFEWCKKLGEVIIPESVEAIGTLAFAYCGNATIILKRCTKDFKFIGNCAFYYTKDVEEKTRN